MNKPTLEAINKQRASEVFELVKIFLYVITMLFGGDDRWQWIGLAVTVTAVAGISLAATVAYSNGSLQSPSSSKKLNKHAKQWKSFFTAQGKLTDGGVKFLTEVRSGGVDPSLRAEVWPFLLGVYDLNSSKKERESVKNKRKKEYDDLRRQCQELLTQNETSSLELSNTTEGYVTWQGIIRRDAVRAIDDWRNSSPDQADVSKMIAHRLAESVGMKDYEHLKPHKIFHAARLVAILEAYALYDPEIGYCQGMSDLLAPIIAVMEEDHEAFWCFVCFMKKARDNFRMDETGITRQLNMISMIIKGKDVALYRHLKKHKAEELYFVYRMVLVLLRRELTFEQTLCLWEVMWAEQAAIRVGVSKFASGGAPPVEDLLLYAIAACVLQYSELIVDKCSSMEEIMGVCNSMAGWLDVSKLLDDAHDLVVTLHDKI